MVLKARRDRNALLWELEGGIFHSEGNTRAQTGQISTPSQPNCDSPQGSRPAGNSPGSATRAAGLHRDGSGMEMGAGWGGERDGIGAGLRDGIGMGWG